MILVKRLSHRRLQIAASTLSLIAVVVINPWRLVAQDALPAQRDKAQTQIDSHELKNQNAKEGVNPKPTNPNIIIAEHVLLWEGNEIATWDGVVARLRVMRVAGPVHPNFFFTHTAAIQAGNWQYWHHEIMDLYRELFEPAGISMGSISPRASPRYDAIKTPDDLLPNPDLARYGQVLDPDGKPVAGAQVFILPTTNMNGTFLNTGVCLKGTQLRDPFDEQCTKTNNRGEFTVYPGENEYYIAALHPSGSALQRVSAKDNKSLKVELHLQPWAIVTISGPKESAGQAADLSAIPTGADAEWPNFEVYSIEIADTPIETKVPAGKIVVRRSLKMGQGTSISLPQETFSLLPGEHRILELKPPSEEERTRAKQMFDDLNHRGGN